MCTLVLGLGSEILQGLLPNGRAFDPFDVLANIVGSLGAIGLCSWYHRRMLERRRKARFGALASAAAAGAGDDDVELGLASGPGGGAHDGSGIGPQESGVTTLEQEVDNWDENEVDNWDTEDGPDEEDALAGTSKKSGDAETTQKTPQTSTTGVGDTKKRSD